MCVDLYFTLRNPFHKPVSNSVWIHVLVILLACIITIPIGASRLFVYREEFQFCWTIYKEGFNFWHLFVVYLPVISVAIGGIIVTYWSLKRLKSRMLNDTFELRWKIIKRQTVIVACFTISYFCQGVIWMMTFMDHRNQLILSEPYLLSIFVLSGVFFDLIAWCAKDVLLLCWENNMPLSSSNDLKMSLDSTIEIKQLILKDHNQPYKSPNIGGQNPKNRSVTARTQLLQQKYSRTPKKEKDGLSAQNLSNALRREVITFITAGLVTGVKVTAWETKNEYIQISQHGQIKTSMDDYREDTEFKTHPALLLFHYQQTKKKPQAKHYGKAHSYAEYLFAHEQYQTKIGKKEEEDEDSIDDKYSNVCDDNEYNEYNIVPEQKYSNVNDDNYSQDMTSSSNETPDISPDMTSSNDDNYFTRYGSSV
eukprot:523064_1